MLGSPCDDVREGKDRDRNNLVARCVTLSSRFVIRPIFSTVVALLLAFPAASQASAVPKGIALTGPTNCCCPADEEEETPPPARIDRSCCCDLQNVQAQLSPPAPSIVPATQLNLHATASRIESGLVTLPMVCTALSAGINSARGPPLRTSLLSQHTSLLL